MKAENRELERLASLLGMARRAGKLVTGFDAVVALFAEKTASCVLLAADLSEKTEKELRFAANKAGSADAAAMPIYKIPLSKEDVSHSLGLKKPVGILALTDQGFAASAEKLFQAFQPRL